MDASAGTRADDGFDASIAPVAVLTGFARALRAAGVAADTSRLGQAVEALALLDASNADDVYWAGRVTLCAGPAQ
nr:hypothetical protein [Micromonospora sp. DSM 115978]